jgi:hypothetical protein
MTTVRVERRLAAIMAADIVGYSRLIETDEARTLAAIRILRSEVMDPLFAEHKGRIVKLMGYYQGWRLFLTPGANSPGQTINRRPPFPEHER